MSTGSSWGAETGRERLLTQPFPAASIGVTQNGWETCCCSSPERGGWWSPAKRGCVQPGNASMVQKKGYAGFSRGCLGGNPAGGLFDRGCRHLRSCRICSACRRVKLPNLEGCSDSSSALPSQGLSWVQPFLHVEERRVDSLVLPEPLSASSPFFSLNHPTKNPQNNASITL